MSNIFNELEDEWGLQQDDWNLDQWRGADEQHPLAVLVSLLSDFIADYEEKHSQTPVVTGRAMLAFLMEQHGLKQTDLSEIGSQGVVSELLNGKREFTTNHIKLLAARFNVPVSVFLT